MKNKKPFHKRVLFVISNPSIYLNLFKYHLKVTIEKIKGVNFTKIEQATALNLVGTQYNGYWSSNNNYLITVLTQLQLNKNLPIIDIGCGKGEVLLVLKKFGFNNVAGIELTKYLFDIATNNFIKLKINSINLFQINAIEFDNYVNYNYYYLYNPFQEAVMDKVIKKIEKTLEQKHREVIIIYKNPVCHNTIIKGNVFKLVNEFPTEIKEIKFYIYSNSTLST